MWKDSESVICVGVFCAALTIYFQPTYVILDPICTFLFSILVLCTTIKILKAVIWSLVNTLNNVYLIQAQAKILSISIRLTAGHTRSTDGSYTTRC